MKTIIGVKLIISQEKSSTLINYVEMYNTETLEDLANYFCQLKGLDFYSILFYDSNNTPLHLLNKKIGDIGFKNEKKLLLYASYQIIKEKIEIKENLYDTYSKTNKKIIDELVEKTGKPQSLIIEFFEKNNRKKKNTLQELLNLDK